MKPALSLLRWIENHPTMALTLGGIVTLLFTLLMAITVVMLPSSSIDVRGANGGTFDVASLPGVPDGSASFIDGSGRERLVLPLGHLENGKELRGSSQQIRAFMARRDQIAVLLQEPGMQLRLPNGQLIPAFAESAGWDHVGWDVWLVLISGVIAAMAGLWVFVLRPRDEGARAFAASGIAYLVITYTVAWYIVDNPAMSGQHFMAFEATNLMACFITAMELIWLFARYPVALVPRWCLWLAYSVSIASCCVALGLPIPNVFWFGEVALLCVCPIIIGFVLAQAWLTRRDPVMKAAFLWLGSALLLAIVIGASNDMIPDLFGIPSLLPMASPNVLFALFYVALGIAVARFRLFDLGNWTVTILRTVLLLLLILVVDIGLAILFGQTWLLSIGMVAAVLIWLPLRSWVLRKAERRKGQSNLQLVKGANQVAFTRDIADRRSSWRELLTSQFDPLHISTGDGTQLAIVNDGRGLIVPSPLEDSAHELTFAAQGGRLFNGQDVALAQAMIDLVVEITEAHRAFDRGAETERLRIARDLHDDVGARLLTSLHREDLSAVRADVREAMADMRMLIDGLSDQARRLNDMIADLRHETVNRLKLAGIAVQWPVIDCFDDDIAIPHSVSRVIYSVTRELATNVIRHSGAGQVDVAFSRRAGGIFFSIEDDGRGFIRTENPAIGNGMQNARKRVQEIGGSLEVVQPADGTRIEVQVPLASHD